MKIIFYKELLPMKHYTPTEKIVYSFLIYKSLTSVDCAFTRDGSELNIGEITDALSYDDMVDMYSISQRKMASELNITYKSAYSCLLSIASNGDIDKENNKIRISPNIINGRYFPLIIDSGLKGELLIFYSYLKNKGEYYGGAIDTYKYKIAEDFCTTKIAVTNMLNRLYRKGFAERLENGKLKIN